MASSVPLLQLYFWGVFGSAAVEIAAVVKASADAGGTCPAPYNQSFYIAARALLALCAGALPVALDAPNILTALYIGAGAPLFFDKATRGFEGKAR